MHSCLSHGPPQVWRAHFSTLPSITAASLRTPALQDPQRAALPAMMLHRCWRHKKMRIGNICSYCRIVVLLLASSIHRRRWRRLLSCAGGAEGELSGAAAAPEAGVGASGVAPTPTGNFPADSKLARSMRLLPKFCEDSLTLSSTSFVFFMRELASSI